MGKHVATALSLLMASSIAWAANSTTTGELIGDPPTLIVLGFAWPIKGDNNRNARMASLSSRRCRRSAMLGSSATTMAAHSKANVTNTEAAISFLMDYSPSESKQAQPINCPPHLGQRSCSQFG